MTNSDYTHKSKKGLYKRLLKTIKPYWLVLFIAFIGNMVYAAVDSYSIHLFKPILDKGFVNKDMAFLSILPWIVLGLFILRGIASFIATYSMGWMGRKVVYHFRALLFNKYLKLPADYFDQNTTGDLLAKLTYHVEQITAATSSALTTLVQQGCFVIGLLIVMFITSWKFTLVILIILPIVMLIVSFVSKRFRVLSKRIQNAMGNINHVAEETIQGYKEVRLFGAQEQQSKYFDKIIHYNFVQELKMIFTNALSSPLIQLIGAGVLALIIYLAVGTQAHIAISAGGFVVLMSSMLAILKPIKSLSNVNATIQKALAATADVFEMLDAPEEKELGDQILSKPVSGAMTFKNISFSYPSNPDLPTLQNINLSIQKGQMVAIVGRSGAGKSSLVNILTGFYRPNLGEIYLDETSIAEITLESLRDQIAMVSQHVVLFNDSIANNISLGLKENISEHKIIKALKDAHAWEFVQKLPEGIHTKVGENGLNLSGGQRQRIAIARAILSQKPILILDEATSALDTESEQAIQTAIENMSITRIVIAHRLSTVFKADQIIVLDQGQIIEQGTHNQLLNNKNIYAQLVKQQSAD